MISKEKLQMISELKLSGLIEEMDNVMLDEYTLRLDAFVETLPVYEARLKEAFAAGEYDSFSRILMIIKDTLMSIYANDLAVICQKLMDDVNVSKREVAEAYLYYFLTTISELSIDIQMANYREDHSQNPEAYGEHSKESGKKCILAVDDSPMSLSLIESVLVGSQYKFIGMASVTTTLKFVKANKPDLFILDIEMPEMNGYELAGRLREIGHTAPIIFLTGNSSKQYVMKAIQAGAADFIVKPINRENMLDKINKYLS